MQAQPVEQERTSTRIFATLCHLTGGDRDAAERLLIAVYLDGHQIGQPLTEAADATLIRRAHRCYLADARSTATTRTKTTVPVGSTDWLRARSATLAAMLAELPPEQRVALSLTVAEGLALLDVATVLDVDIDRAERLLSEAMTSLGSLDSDVAAIHDAFGFDEQWLDDDARTRVDAALALAQQPPPRRRRRRSPRVRNALLLGSLIGVVGAFGTHWVAGNDQGGGPSVSFVVPATTTTLSAAFVAVRSPGRSVVLDPRGRQLNEVTYNADGSAGTFTADLATGLTNPADVEPDVIARFANGRIGLSWTGPCNRPATLVELDNNGPTTTVRLQTGEFPTVSCVGMPDRWTVVVAPTIPISTAPLEPVTAGVIDHSFGGYVLEQAAPSDDVPASATVSVLVDSANQPWPAVPTADCVGPTGRYQSPAGAIWEVDRDDTRDCSGPGLVGPDGARFPHGAPAGGSDCHGPYGSATDIPSSKPYTTTFYDGDWFTWDGCLVNSKVIYSKDRWPACGWSNVRTISFDEHVGEHITTSARQLDYIDDPAGVVRSGTLEPTTVTALPSSAVDTGFRFGAEQLWTVAADPSSIYIVTGAQIEQWPRLTAPPTCSGL
ncbi:MAG TPA: hypothetical protein VGM78_11465 [Ilumatobacteraceae bacterium]